MSLGDSAFARDEFRHLLFGALAAFGAEWHSTPADLTAAAYKPTQLAWVRRDGRLTAPDTLITSSPGDARAYLGNDPSRFVVKPLSRGTIETDKGFDALHTSRVTPHLVDRIDEVRHAPCIIQRFVPRAFDVRLNVIGRSVFAAQLDTFGATEAETDSRRVFYADLGYATIDPPADVAEACVAMCEHFAITFGAFDFAIDREGRWFFLELNPWGQWAWIEEMTGQPIAAAFAAFFASRLAAGRTAS